MRYFIPHPGGVADEHAVLLDQIMKVSLRIFARCWS
jgi:hypothetical protein